MSFSAVNQFEQRRKDVTERSTVLFVAVIVVVLLSMCAVYGQDGGAGEGTEEPGKRIKPESTEVDTKLDQAWKEVKRAHRLPDSVENNREFVRSVNDFYEVWEEQNKDDMSEQVETNNIRRIKWIERFIGDHIDAVVDDRVEKMTRLAKGGEFSEAKESWKEFTRRYRWVREKTKNKFELGERALKMFNEVKDLEHRWDNKERARDKLDIEELITRRWKPFLEDCEDIRAEYKDPLLKPLRQKIEKLKAQCGRWARNVLQETASKHIRARDLKEARGFLETAREEFGGGDANETEGEIKTKIGLLDKLIELDNQRDNIKEFASQSPSEHGEIVDKWKAFVRRSNEFQEKCDDTSIKDVVDDFVKEAKREVIPHLKNDLRRQAAGDMEDGKYSTAIEKWTDYAGLGQSAIRESAPEEVSQLVVEELDDRWQNIPEGSAHNAKKNALEEFMGVCRELSGDIPSKSKDKRYGKVRESIEGWEDKATEKLERTREDAVEGNNVSSVKRDEGGSMSWVAVGAICVPVLGLVLLILWYWKWEVKEHQSEWGRANTQESEGQRSQGHVSANERDVTQAGTSADGGATADAVPSNDDSQGTTGSVVKQEMSKFEQKIDDKMDQQAKILDKLNARFERIDENYTFLQNYVDDTDEAKHDLTDGDGKGKGNVADRLGGVAKKIRKLTKFLEQQVEFSKDIDRLAESVEEQRESLPSELKRIRNHLQGLGAINEALDSLADRREAVVELDDHLATTCNRLPEVSKSLRKELGKGGKLVEASQTLDDLVDKYEEKLKQLQTIEASLPNLNQAQKVVSSISNKRKSLASLDSTLGQLVDRTQETQAILNATLGAEADPDAGTLLYSLQRLKKQSNAMEEQVEVTEELKDKLGDIQPDAHGRIQAMIEFKEFVTRQKQEIEEEHMALQNRKDELAERRQEVEEERQEAARQRREATDILERGKQMWPVVLQEGIDSDEMDEMRRVLLDGMTEEGNVEANDAVADVSRRVVGKMMELEGYSNEDGPERGIHELSKALYRLLHLKEVQGDRRETLLGALQEYYCDNFQVAIEIIGEESEFNPDVMKQNGNGQGQVTRVLSWFVEGQHGQGGRFRALVEL